MERLAELPPNVLPLRGEVKGSFAYVTVKDRLPVILTKAIDTLTRTLHAETDDYPAEKTAEAKDCISQLSKLTYELQRDRPLDILRDSEEDAETWNFLLGAVAKDKKTWFSAPWLFVECYMYRKIREIFSRTKYWKDFDVFAAQQKEPALFGSLKSVEELGKHLHDVELSLTNELERKAILKEFLQFSLWGNQTDLSLLINVTHADIHAMQTTSAGSLAKVEEKVIVNDLEKVLQRLEGIKRGRVDIILDNAGFELFADLCLADWLVHSSTAAKIVFHAKAFPWFVSDTTHRDFKWTLDAVENHARATNNAILLHRLEKWRALLADGTWEVRVDPFWTLPYPFWQLPTAGKHIYEYMCRSDFLIFKGDLNYRKAVYDAEWPVTTPFKEALGPLANDKTPPLLLLRTCKSDVAVGLKPGQAEQLTAEDKGWMVNGKFGMIQYHSSS
ncbi:uncharacterized protein SPPG_01355 [Spizellomyces punctatus DAOM BR117]|uniref:Sugar phosphate phosphatase n=1 Tax=Spizellomyces punctatus (strain DAOM BR117) TaxID=645134 RepID=A0A0L0HS04_SPIPD|nr:hypothetical protein, variant [Spizellomyces punctatus DAOM BR117]XP_016611942.1 uncharacterized protein SPPG_01355 [Spizellomyces punctatus DAOM BR117]KND03902.1 hypothetical protein, variant [Spizellomyces punctatus DAOM BR117]KND03903.1 hypothetical protein SPPG_01355 [Spizellomyces punctatus DAOM BR117]|eukprot:XP_016611941.1 hypothetical protein, variant [Spizellomyces punctatus DAOM BR117]